MCVLGPVCLDWILKRVVHTRAFLVGVYEMSVLRVDLTGP
jgi:hypothetical protein